MPILDNNNNKLYNQICKWIQNSINKINIGLYMNCFNFNCERIKEYLIQQIIKNFHVSESTADLICNDNINLIQQYVNTHQPKSFQDYIGMSKQQLVLAIQKEIIKYTNNNIKDLLHIVNWPKNNDTGLYNLNYQPDKYLKEYFFDENQENDFDINVVIKSVCPNYKLLRYVCFNNIMDLLKSPSWNKTFQLIKNKLLAYVTAENKKIEQKLIQHRQKITKIEDSDQRKMNIDFGTWTPYLRDAPIIVIREFINDIKTEYADHVLIGHYGQHHNSLMNSHPELRLKCRDSNNMEIFNCGYLHGLIAFLSTLEYNGYNSLQEVANIIKRKEPNILKVFLSPPSRNSGGEITQLANKKRRLYIKI